MKIKENAARYFAEKKYNCCQAVICAYCDEYGINDEDIFKLAEGFGSGMVLRDTCGAVTGMYMAIGMHNSAGDKMNVLKTKANTYEAIRKLSKEFELECGSIYCREIKAVKEGKPIVSCQACVEKAAELVEKFIEQR